MIKIDINVILAIGILVIVMLSNLINLVLRNIYNDMLKCVFKMDGQSAMDYTTMASVMGDVGKPEFRELTLKARKFEKFSVVCSSILYIYSICVVIAVGFYIIK